jgi:hypothetical protein
LSIDVYIEECGQNKAGPINRVSLPGATRLPEAASTAKPEDQDVFALLQKRSKSTMNSTRYVVLAFAFACGLAHASGSGEVTMRGTVTKLTHVYAYHRPDDFHKELQLTSLVFTTQTVDTAKVNAAKNPIDEITSELKWKAPYVQLDIRPNGSVPHVEFRAASGEGSSGNTLDKPTLTRNDSKRIEGSFRTSDEKQKTNDTGVYYDLNFALDIPATGSN